MSVNDLRKRSDEIHSQLVELLHERASVQTYWQHANQDLSWFDARYALPLPAAGEQAIYLIASSSPLPADHRAFLEQRGQVVHEVSSSESDPALTVITVNGATELAPLPANQQPSIQFTDRLTLTAASLVQTDTGEYALRLSWQTSGPDPSVWPAYRLEIRMGGENAGASDWQGTVPFDAFRPPEWVAGGRFLSWHRLEGLTGTPPTNFSLRLISQQDGKPVTGPNTPDGWQAIQLTQAP